ncbi:hypothetical protein APHAL10511_008707 [Amanita phalloides]|nr:hypothetical protein APHAL10511_008707 [Amanita phalloides]
MPLLQPRNVFLRDYDGNVLAGFWQYGSIAWSTFSTLLNSLIQTDHQWAIFAFDETNADRHGAEQQLGSEMVLPGVYVLLRQDGRPLPVVLTGERARPRQPTHSATPARQNHYRNRVRQRDGKCLVTGRTFANWAPLKAAHIFPRAHVDEWLKKGFRSLITDSAPETTIGGYSEIDSVQNVIMLQSDLHEMWDDYEFGVNPDDNYRITAFINGLSHVHGLVLQLDHIEDSTIRPLDALFRDHFLQCVLKHMKGAGEPTWDYEDAFGDGAFDLSNQDLWGSAEGKERLELEFVDRLFEHQVAQDLARWKASKAFVLALKAVEHCSMRLFAKKTLNGCQSHDLLSNSAALLVVRRRLGPEPIEADSKVAFSLLGLQLQFPQSTNNAAPERKMIVVLFEERDNVGGIWLPESCPKPPPTVPKTPIYPGLHSMSAMPIAQQHDLLPFIRFNHRVLNASWVGTPDAGVCNVTFLNHLNKTHYRLIERLVGASGKYNAPHIPSWPGQDEWLGKATGGDNVQREILHSAWYRGPEKYSNKSILIVGDSFSGRDVAAQTAPLVSKIIVSIRAKNDRDRVMGPFPLNVMRKPAISHFTQDFVVFMDNTTFDVDSVILATGYRLRKAFLEAGNTSVTDPKAISNTIETEMLVSNTHYISPLFKHIFSLSPMYPPTTLAFIGLLSVNGSWHTNIAQSMFVAHTLLNPSLLSSRRQMLVDLALQEERSKDAGVDPYVCGHIMPEGDWASDYQDELVDYLKQKNGGKKFVEEWRRDIYKYRYLKRGWERIEKLREGDEWVKSVTTEEEWSLTDMGYNGPLSAVLCRCRVATSKAAMIWWCYVSASCHTKDLILFSQVKKRVKRAWCLEE